MPKPQEVTLATISSGAAEQGFQRLLREVHANIKDPNTKADAKREISVKLTFQPGPDRDLSVVVIATTAKLAPPQAKASQVFFGTQRGEPVVTSNDLNQFDLEDEAEAAASSTINLQARRVAGEN